MQWSEFYQQILSCLSNDYNSTDSQNLHACDPAALSLLNHIIESLPTSNDTTGLTELASSLIDFSDHNILSFAYKDVPQCWRQLYTDATLAKACCLLKDLSLDQKDPLRVDLVCAELIKSLDMAIVISGAPGKGRRELMDRILSAAQETLSQSRKVRKKQSGDESSESGPNKRPRTSKEVFTSSSDLVPVLTHPVEKLSDPPSLVDFSLHVNSHRPTPLVIPPPAISHWPAFTTHPWSDIDYLLDIASDRLVPIEIGAKYTDDSWTQKMMPFGEFVRQFITDPESDSSSDKVNPIAYLAQHDLFTQIPRLRQDIIVPDYCYLSPMPTQNYTPPVDVIINAWFGPMGTVSPLHHDPYHNLLTQVVGRKYIRLYAPEENAKVYPFEEGMGNTSQVDVEKPDLENFPDFAEATFIEHILNPGEMLYIPPKWWHFVKSLDVSFSVSFWF